jgi:hypothetical protein
VGFARTFQVSESISVAIEKGGMLFVAAQLAPEEPVISQSRVELRE